MASLASESTLEAKTIRRHFNDLVRAIGDPLMLAADLYAKNIITRDTLYTVKDTTGPPNNKTMTLLGKVSDHVSLRPEAYQEFVTILGETQGSAAMEQVLQSMQQTGWYHRWWTLIKNHLCCM